MKLKKTISVLVALALIISTATIATAESTETAQEAMTADDGTATTVYTLDEMLNQAMTDAYKRQASYTAFAEAFPDSRSIAGLDMDTQIVLLEMLLKANGVALPANDSTVTVPETVGEAYAAIANAEQNALTMYRSFLQQEDLSPDAKIIFRSVFGRVRGNAATFTMKTRTAQRIQQFQELINSDNAQVYVINNDRGRGVRVVYMVTNDETTDTTDATEPPTEDDSVNN